MLNNLNSYERRGAGRTSKLLSRKSLPRFGGGLGVGYLKTKDESKKIKV
jgi:hypothetical protein